MQLFSAENTLESEGKLFNFTFNVFKRKWRREKLNFLKIKTHKTFLQLPRPTI